MPPPSRASREQREEVSTLQRSPERAANPALPPTPNSHSTLLFLPPQFLRALPFNRILTPDELAAHGLFPWAPPEESAPSGAYREAFLGEGKVGEVELEEGEIYEDPTVPPAAARPPKRRAPPKTRILAPASVLEDKAEPPAKIEWSGQRRRREAKEQRAEQAKQGGGEGGANGSSSAADADYLSHNYGGGDSVQTHLPDALPAIDLPSPGISSFSALQSVGGSSGSVPLPGPAAPLPAPSPALAGMPMDAVFSPAPSSSLSPLSSARSPLSSRRSDGSSVAEVSDGEGGEDQSDDAEGAVVRPRGPKRRVWTDSESEDEDEGGGPGGQLYILHGGQLREAYICGLRGCPYIGTRANVAGHRNWDGCQGRWPKKLVEAGEGHAGEYDGFTGDVSWETIWTAIVEFVDEHNKDTEDDKQKLFACPFEECKRLCRYSDRQRHSDYPHPIQNKTQKVETTPKNGVATPLPVPDQWRAATRAWE
ncbi:hypothetical protein JCM10213_001644 [Rhodosporidiobolus nylandii]